MQSINIIINIKNLSYDISSTETRVIESGPYDLLLLPVTKNHLPVQILTRGDQFSELLLSILLYYTLYIIVLKSCIYFMFNFKLFLQRKRLRRVPARDRSRQGDAFKYQCV